MAARGPLPWHCTPAALRGNVCVHRPSTLQHVLQVAQSIISLREGDGHSNGPTFEMPSGPYSMWEHQPDPNVHPEQPLYAPHWGDVQPFMFNNAMDGKVMTMPEPLHENYVVRTLSPLAQDRHQLCCRPGRCVCSHARCQLLTPIVDGKHRSHLSALNCLVQC